VSSGISRGDEVQHATHGRGIVLTLRHGTYECLVRFGDRERWIRAVDLAQLGRRREPPTGPTRKRPRTITDSNTIKSLFEAFRLGIVPHRHIADWTFGRTEQTDFILGWLGDQGSGSLVLEGAYGSGKSHLLEYVYAQALERGYAVATVGFDPSESPAAFPKRVYRRLVQSIRVPVAGRVLEFREALREAAERPSSSVLDRHSLLGPLLHLIREGKAPPRLWEELEGRRERAEFLSLYDHTTSANQYCYLLTGLGHLFAVALGVRGMTILFDEVETAQTYEYGYQWRRSLNFLRGLSLAANDHPELLDEAVDKRGDAHKGETTGLVYSGHNPVPYLFAIPSFLKVVFAITPGAFTTEFLKWHPDQPVLELPRLGSQALRMLFGAMHDAYSSVYGASLDPAERTRAFEEVGTRTEMQSTRLFIKALVEVLDFRRFNPGEPLDRLFVQRGF
jgi:hypothetical protein